MAKYVQVDKVTGATENGPKTLYNVEVIDSETGKTVQQHGVDDPAAASYLATHLENLHNAQAAADSAMADNDGDGYPDSLQTPNEPQNTTLPSSAAKAGRKPRVRTDPGETTYQPGSNANPPSPGTERRSSSLKKAARDLCGMSKKRKKEFLRLTEEQRIERKINGTFGNKRVQSMGIRENAPSETIVGRGIDNNAFIIIGNDRPGKLHEGYGGKGHTQCDCIDLVAGLGGPCLEEVEEIKLVAADGSDDIIEKPKTHNPNFFVDAARIYISQKTDVDKNFGIGEFGPSNNKDQDKDPKDIGKHGAKSAVVVKADNIRIIGRESIRIVTGTDKYNSVNGQILGQTGIEIIAMNKIKELQPMVLGDNLVELLEKIIDKVDALAKIEQGYMKYQMKFNQAIQHHTHISPFFGIPTLPAQTLLTSGVQCDIEQTMNTELSYIKTLTNLTGLKMNYLESSGDKHISSRLNKCN